MSKGDNSTGGGDQKPPLSEDLIPTGHGTYKLRPGVLEKWDAKLEEEMRPIIEAMDRRRMESRARAPFIPVSNSANSWGGKKE